MISIEATRSEGKVFGLYENENVLVTDDPEVLEAVRNALSNSLEFINRWLSSRRSETSPACIPSKVQKQAGR